MKHLISLVMAAGFPALSLPLAAHAAGMTQAQAAKQINAMAGTYVCGSGKTAHTAVFKSLYGGRALVIDESGNLDQNVFDARRQKWIDEHIDASGNYSVMEGTPNAHGIDFTAAYPSGFDGKLIVHMPSARKMTMRMTMTMNGKTHTENETCVKK